MADEGAAASTPPHVPADRVFDFDVYGVHPADKDYALAFRECVGPDVPNVCWTPRNGGHWIVTSAEGIDLLYTDLDHFTSTCITIPAERSPDPLMLPVMSDPPEWMTYRLPFNRALAPKSVVPLAEEARRLAVELIEDLQPRGRCEFVGDFALRLPIAVFMKMADLPEADREFLLEAVAATLRSKSEVEQRAAYGRLADYARRKVEERRANPRPDAISDMASIQVDGNPIPVHTVTGMVALLLSAGLDTVASMMGFIMSFLARNPEYRRELIDHRERIPDAVEELLRRFPIVVSARMVKADFEYDGVKLKAGEMVAAPTPLHGLDERRYACPAHVDFDRKPRHATFGGGVHRCPGATLARAELKILLEEWLARIPDFEIEPGAPVPVEARGVAAILELPLIWSPR